MSFNSSFYKLDDGLYYNSDDFLSRPLANSVRVLNMPNPTAIWNLRVFKDRLDSYAKAYGKRIDLSSCYRSEELNKAVGGCHNSVHTLGLAADLIIPADEQEKFVEVLKEAGCKWHTAILYPNRKAHFHIDCRTKDSSLPCNVEFNFSE